MSQETLPAWVWDAQEEGALLLDARRRVVAANRAAASLLGVGAAELIGRALPAPVAAPEMARVREHPGPASGDDGLTLVTLTDVSREVRAREAVERIAQSVEEFLFLRRLEPDGRAPIVYASPGVEALLGGPAPLGQSIEATWMAAIHPEDREATAAAMARTRDGEPVTIEYRLIGLDNRVRWVRSRTQRRTDPDGISYVDGIVSDVTAEHEHAEEMAGFRAVVEASGSAIALLDPDWRVRWMNSAGLAMTGLTPATMAGVPYLELVGDEARAEHMNVERPTVDRDGRWAGASVLLPIDRGRRPLPVEATSYKILHPATGEALGLACIRRDVSDMQRLAREHAAIGTLATAIASGARREEIYETACREAAHLLGADAGGIAMLGVTAHGGARMVGTWRSPGADDRLELSVGRLAPGLAADGAGNDPDAAAWALELGDDHHGLGAAVVVEGRPWGLIVACRRGDPFSAEDERALSRLGGVVGMGVGVAISREQLVRQATTDGLTGLLNHRAFHEALRAEAERCTRYGRPLSVVLLDLDGFKGVNDRHGHQAGDALLVAVARALEELTRASEVVARLGGDEFALLLPETTAEGARATAERVRAAIAALEDEVRHAVTLSAGCADLAGAAGTTDALMREADRALYRAKGGRRRDAR
jgi:diguanylate cyclase (GGDEF)-like protein/PAS domain S-box-containing protein